MESRQAGYQVYSEGTLPWSGKPRPGHGAVKKCRKGITYGGGGTKTQKTKKRRKRKREMKSTDEYILGSCPIWEREFKEYTFHKNLVLHGDGFM